MNSNIFNSLYSKYYDLTYANKDYSSEVSFFNALIKKFGTKNSKKIVSLGSGTLNHEKHLAKLGYEITAVDLSEKMVELANRKIDKENLQNIKVVVGNMMNWTPDQEYDVVLSMFNVVSYCQNLNELESVIKTAKKSLKKDGVLIFDCWNAKAVKKDPPKSRFVKFTDGKTELYRLTEATPLLSEDSINLDIELLEIKDGVLTGRETENHKVRAWNIADVKAILKRNGFEFKLSCQFGNMKLPISDKKWAMTIVAKSK